MELNPEGNGEFRYLFSRPSSPTFYEQVAQKLSEHTVRTVRILAATITLTEVEQLEAALRTHIGDGGEVNIVIGAEIVPDPEAIRRLRDMQADNEARMQLHLAETVDDNARLTQTTVWFESESSHQVFLPTDSRTKTVSAQDTPTCLVGEFETGDQRGIVRELRTLWKELYLPKKWVELYPPSAKVVHKLESLREDGATTTTPELPSQETAYTVWPLQSDSRELLMDLTGESRDNQVQPIFLVWENFFGVETDSTTFAQMNSEDLNVTYDLVGAKTSNREIRELVVHDHQLTIELEQYRGINPDDYDDDPILIMREIGTREYAYRIVTPDNEIYDEVNETLETNQQTAYMSPQSDRRVYISEPLDGEIRVPLPDESDS